MSKYLRPYVEPGNRIYFLVEKIRDDFPSAISNTLDNMPSSIKEMLDIVSLLLQFVAFNAKYISDDILLAGRDLSCVQLEYDYIKRGKKHILILIDEIEQLSIDDELKLVPFLKENKQKYDDSLDEFLKSDNEIRTKIQANENVMHLMADYNRALNHFLAIKIKFVANIVGFYQPLADV